MILHQKIAFTLVDKKVDLDTFINEMQNLNR